MGKEEKGEVVVVEEDLIHIRESEYIYKEGAPCFVLPLSTSPLSMLLAGKQYSAPGKAKQSRSKPRKANSPLC